MEVLNRWLSRVENVLAAGTLGLAALISIANMTLRQFGQAWFWSEEAVIYLIIYSTFIGAVVTLRHNEHVSVDILTVFFKKRGKRVMALIAITTTLVYLAIIGYLSWMLIAEPFSRSTTTAAMGLPLWMVELAVPIGMTLMFLRGLEIFWRTWQHGAEEDDPEAVLAAEAEATGMSAQDLEARKEALQNAEGQALQDTLTEEETRKHSESGPDSSPQEPPEDPGTGPNGGER